MQCYYCKKYFPKKAVAMEHLEKMHGDDLVRDGISSAQACYLTSHADIHGRCVVCGKPTQWSDLLGKPHRLCGSQKCKDKCCADARRNLDAALHLTQRELMSDPKHQQEMLNHRRIAGTYKFRTDGGTVGYVGQLEKNFLWFCDTIMDMPSHMFTDPPEAFPYTDPTDGTTHIYIPDYYIGDANLLVEIKDGGEKVNTNPEFLRTTRYKVALKDEAMRKQSKYNYIRLAGSNYGPFLEILYQITHQEKGVAGAPKNIVVIKEDAEPTLDELIVSETVDPTRVRLAVTYYPETTEPAALAITDSNYLASWYVSEGCGVHQETLGELGLGEMDHRLYRYAGDGEAMARLFHRLGTLGESVDTSLLGLLRECGIQFDDGGRLRTDPHRRSDFIPLTQGGDAS